MLALSDAAGAEKTLARKIPLALGHRRLADELTDCLRCLRAICGVRHPDMAVVEDRVVPSVGLVELGQRLADQEALDPVPGGEGEGGQGVIHVD